MLNFSFYTRYSYGTERGELRDMLKSHVECIFSYNFCFQTNKLFLNGLFFIKISHFVHWAYILSDVKHLITNLFIFFTKQKKVWAFYLRARVNHKYTLLTDYEQFLFCIHWAYMENETTINQHNCRQPERERASHFTARAFWRFRSGRHQDITIEIMGTRCVPLYIFFFQSLPKHISQKLVWIRQNAIFRQTIFPLFPRARIGPYPLSSSPRVYYSFSRASFN